MGRKKLKRKQLKWRILKNIFGVLAVSMILSSIAGYIYFEQIVRDQKISDERAKLQQVANQLAFMTEDIQKFAKSIIVDESLQELLEKETFQSEFERRRNYASVAKRLVFYNSLRQYIGSSILEMENGTYYGSSYSTVDEGYVERKLKNQAIVEYTQNARYIYSDPYYETENDAGPPMICYRILMWDKYHFGKPKGTLYMEVSLDYFLKQIQAYGENYENVCLLGNDQKILYEQDPGQIIQNYLKAGNELRESGTYKTNGGYLISESIDASGWKLCTLITDRYLWQRSRFVLEFFLLSFLLSIGLTLVFASRIMENMTSPLSKLSGQMEKIGYGKLETIEMVSTGDEIQTLYECFEHMLHEIWEGEEKRIQYEKQKKEMEFDIMLSQINPHYLYNVLNTVVYLAAAEKNEKVVKIVRSLIYTLQETLNVGEHNVETTVEKELELTGCYLEIQKYRYPDMFQTNIQCQEELKQYLVPKTIIQPLVENAILHGILPKEVPGSIAVTISLMENGLYITVEDDGIGISREGMDLFYAGKEMSAGKNDRKHIGISNVRDRIRYLYGEMYGMEIVRRKEGGTRVILHLPAIGNPNPETGQESIKGEVTE